MAVYAAYQHDVTNESGDLLTNVLVRVTDETDGSLPQLYDGPNTATATALGNPYTQADGKVYFHCEGGAYKIVLTSGVYTRTLRYIPIGRAGETDLTVTTPMGLWVVGTTYGAGDLVSYTGSKLFISLVDSNLANTPDATTPGDTAYWMYVGVAVSGIIGDWQGAWVTATAYALNDAVSNGGSSYICLEPHTSGTFATDLAAGKWELVASKGDTGATGAAGTDGADGTGLFTRVRVVDTTGAAVATAYENGDTIDGVVLATGDLVLRATSGGNASDGVYVVPASGAASRDTSFDTYDEHPGVYVSVMEGTANADTLWRCTSNKGGTLDTTAIVFEEFTGGTTVPFTAASAAGAASLDLAEDTDNGASKTVLQGAAALAGDITVTLPDTTDTLVGKATTDTLTNKTLTTPTITLKQSAAPTPTAEGDIQWDTDGNFIVVGDGAATKYFYPVRDGTWTPAYTGSVSNPTVTHDVQIGQYSRNGRGVHCTLDIRTDATSGGSGDLRVSTPFQVRAGHNPSGPVGRVLAWGAAYPLYWVADEGTSYLTFQVAVNTSTKLQCSDLTNAANSNRITMTFYFETDDA